MDWTNFLGKKSNISAFKCWNKKVDILGLIFDFSEIFRKLHIFSKNFLILISKLLNFFGWNVFFFSICNGPNTPSYFNILDLNWSWKNDLLIPWFRFRWLCFHFLIVAGYRLLICRGTSAAPEFRASCVSVTERRRASPPQWIRVSGLRSRCGSGSPDRGTALCSRLPELRRSGPNWGAD